MLTLNTVTPQRVNNDINGNPRHVIHWTTLLQCEALRQWDEQQCAVNGTYDARLNKNGLSYTIAKSIGKDVGFRPFHNKQFGGGLVVQSYNMTISLEYLEYACQTFVAMQTDNDCLTQHILLQGDQAYITDGGYKTLHACIKAEKRVSRLTLAIVKDWLQGLPSALTVEYMNHAQEQMCMGCGLIDWTSDMYWTYAAKVVLAYKG